MKVHKKDKKKSVTLALVRLFKTCLELLHEPIKQLLTALAEEARVATYSASTLVCQTEYVLNSEGCSRRV